MTASDARADPGGQRWRAWPTARQARVPAAVGDLKLTSGSLYEELQRVPDHRPLGRVRIGHASLATVLAVLRCWRCCPTCVGHLARACKPTVRARRSQQDVQLTRCGERCMIMQLGIPDSCRRCPTLSTQHSALSTQQSYQLTQPVRGDGNRSPRHFQTEKRLTAPAGRPVCDAAHAVALTPPP